MNDNEVRPIFRVLTLGLSVSAWYAVITIVQSELESFNSVVMPHDWTIPLIILPVGILILIGAIAFTYTTLFGYMPNKLFTILFGKRSKNQ
jgi:hypothetical protein